MAKLEFNDIIDISPCLSEELAVFPGDQTFKRQVAMSFEDGHHLGLSQITTTLHIGAHTDAPNHYDPKGEGIDKSSLETYMGPCQVIEVTLNPNERILPSAFNDKIIAPRVLFKTNSFNNPNQWNDHFNSLSPELVNFLNEKNVILVGIDTPSVDPSADKDLLSHKEIAKNKMAILEGIILKNAEAGEYILLCPPLKIKNGDASPVRALLLK